MVVLYVNMIGKVSSLKKAENMKALIKRSELNNIAQEPSLKNKNSNSAGRTPYIRKNKKK